MKKYHRKTSDIICHTDWACLPPRSGHHKAEQHRAQCSVAWSPRCHSPSLLLQTSQLGEPQRPGSLSDNLRGKPWRWKCEEQNRGLLYPSSCGSFVKQFRGFREVTRDSRQDSFPWAWCFRWEGAPLGGEPSCSLSYMPLGTNITACLLPCMLWLRKEWFQECLTSKFLCLFQDFPCNGMLEMWSGRVAAKLLPDYRGGTSSKQSFATASPLHFKGISGNWVSSFFLALRQIHLFFSRQAWTKTRVLLGQKCSTKRSCQCCTELQKVC